MFLLAFFILTANLYANNIKIASGKIDGSYYQVASSICKVVSLKYKKECEVVVTNGSIENKELLKQKKVDFAIVQSFDNTDNFLYKEGVFVIYREGLRINSVSDLIHYKTYVNINSGDYEAFNYLQNKYNIQLNHAVNKKDKYNALCEKEIDYYVLTTKLDSTMLTKYLSLCNLKVLPFNQENTILYNDINIHFVNAVIIGKYKNIDINSIINSNIVKDKL